MNVAMRRWAVAGMEEEEVGGTMQFWLSMSMMWIWRTSTTHFTGVFGDNVPRRTDGQWYLPSNYQCVTCDVKSTDGGWSLPSNYQCVTRICSHHCYYA